MRRIVLGFAIGACFWACSSTSRNNVSEVEVPGGGAAGEGTNLTSDASGGTNAASSGGDSSGGDSSGGSGGGSAGTSEPSTTGMGGTATATSTSGSVGGTSGSTSDNSGGASTAGGSGGATATSGGGATTTGAHTPSILLVTSAAGDYWNTSGSIEKSAAGMNVTVDTTQTAQRWDGFGATFSERGWAYLTSEDMQDAAIELLFSATEGANFAWGSIPIGASDFAMDRYTLADTGSDVAPDGEANRPPEDLALDSFSLERDWDYLIPYIKAAQREKEDLRFWASAWTPPVWMKTGFMANSGADASQPALRPSFYDGGYMRSDADVLAAYAEYFTKFVEGYAAEGIDIEVVAPQAEPSYDHNYPSCLWNSATYAEFIADYLGPALDAVGVRVMLGALANYDTDFDIAAAVLADSTAKGFVSMVGAEWNALDKAKLDALDSGLPYWGTLHKCGNQPWSSGYQLTAPNDHAYAVESWGYIRDAIETVGVTSYNAQNMVLDKVGLGIDTTRHWAQNALLVADGSRVIPTPAYYVFRHLSQYVEPGARVVGTTGGDAVAFENPDNSLVVVLFNAGEANDDYVVALGGDSFEFAMPGQGWATIKYDP